MSESNVAEPSDMGTVVVTGVTGYVGGRLVPELLEAGYKVRCTTRSSAALDDRPWRDRVEVVEADLSVASEVNQVLEGAQAAYYLVHSMSSSGSFETLESEMAEIFVKCADNAGLKQIIYLGGLGHDNETHSAHLASRHAVGEILASGITPVTELRAAVIIGSGSASFEMLRSLVEVLPVMVVPRWVSRTRCQPIAIEDVLSHLVGVLGDEEVIGEVFEIGGPEVLTYRQMMDVYAEVAGLRRRLIIAVPVLTPRLSSHWVNFVSPLPIRLARSLIDSLTSDVVVGNRDIRNKGRTTSFDLNQSINRALARVRDLEMPTRWTNASGAKQISSLTGPAMPALSDPAWSGGRVLSDQRTQITNARCADLMAVLRTVGGDNGWFAFNWLWNLRGFIDTILGGVGIRRGRRHPTDLRVGDTVDFFKVVTVNSNSLRLLGEMKNPGHAWLEWQVVETENGTEIIQRALFVPRGLLGRLYWYALAPPHTLIFKKMLDRIVALAEELSADEQRRNIE